MERILAILKEEEVNFNGAIIDALAQLPPVVYPLGEYVLMAGGKRLRALLVLLCGRMFGCTHRDLYMIGAAIECLHAATLVHDDILDSADTRRGKPAAHKIFGLTETVLSGDVLCALAVKIVASMNDPRLSGILADALSATASGQVAELSLAHSLDVTEESYLGIITGKTAWLIRCACEMGAIRAGASDEAIKALGLFGLELGRAFQLVDDALDIEPEEKTGKPTGGDLREGKFTPLVRFYLENLTGVERIKFTECFSTGQFEPGSIEEIAGAMRVSGCDRHTRELADTHLERAMVALEIFPASSVCVLLHAMPDYVKYRKN